MTKANSNVPFVKHLIQKRENCVLMLRLSICEQKRRKITEIIYIAGNVCGNSKCQIVKPLAGPGDIFKVN